MEHFKIVNVCCFYIQIPINISTNVLTFYFLGFQKGTLFLELKLNHCSLLLFLSCCTRSSYIFWEIMGFLKNYVANMGQIAKKLRKSSIYGAALKLCSLLVTLVLLHHECYQEASSMESTCIIHGINTHHPWNQQASF